MTPEERHQYEARLKVLGELARSDGWKAFSEMVEGLTHVALSKLLKEKDPYEMARLQAAHRTLADLPTWPVREGQAIQEYLKSLAAT
jgi:uncharacterized protein with ATP-grasp and redox domains